MPMDEPLRVTEEVTVALVETAALVRTPVRRWRRVARLGATFASMGRAMGGRTLSRPPTPVACGVLRVSDARLVAGVAVSGA